MIDYEFIEIPGGEFKMGSTREEIEMCIEFWSSRLVDSCYTTGRLREWIEKEFPAHTRNVNRFKIGKFTVTNKQYKSFLSAGGKVPESIDRGFPNDHPVWGLTRAEAMQFCEWFSKETGSSARLPKEVEWECASRGPSWNDYPFGNTFDAQKCNTLESAIGHTTPVDEYPNGVSEYGVWDMAGNVEEWVACDYSSYAGGKLIRDDLVTSLGEVYPILRGGSFAGGGDLARCARRHGPYPSPEFRYTGFRLVCE